MRGIDVMFDSEFCKSEARESLRKSYWGAVGVSFLYVILAGIPDFIINLLRTYTNMFEVYPSVNSMNGGDKIFSRQEKD